MHPKNPHQGDYPLDELVKAYPPLGAHVFQNKFNRQTIDFADPQAVRALNRALLLHYYGISNWELPEAFLCPPVPGRADYLHYLADLLAEAADGKIPEGRSVQILDVGTGASLIYPLLGNRSFGWSFVGSETDARALENARTILAANPATARNIELRLQPDPEHILRAVVADNDIFDACICNPPFHRSATEAEAATRRKQRNLKQKATGRSNFGGQHHELWYPGGELAFLEKMIEESRAFSTQILWFTSLVSKQGHLPRLEHRLDQAGVVEHRVLAMGQGQKKSRILTWTFLDPGRRAKWAQLRWTNKTGRR